MNARATSQVGIGLLGIWAFIEALLIFPRYASVTTFLSEQHGALAALIAMVGPFFLLLGLSYLLVFHTAAVARRLFGRLELEPEGPANDLGPVLVGLLGIFFLLGALPGLVQAWVVTTDLPGELRLKVQAVSITQAAVGLLMILRPAILLRLWQSRGPAAPTGGTT